MTVCVNCGDYKKDGKLFIKYNNSSYKLLDCDKCGKVIDKYIEYDNLNILINIILLKRGVYRHLVYNSDNTISNKRLKYIILSFEVYITWVYQEHLNHLLSFNKSSNTIVKRIISTAGIIETVFKLDAFWQYCFFIQYCLFDQWLMLKLINFQFAKNLYLEKQNKKYSLTVFENTLILSYISRLLFPILMLIWPYDDSIIIPSFIIKWLTNYYLIESINLILYNRKKSLIFNKLIFIFLIIFIVKIILSNLLMNILCLAVTKVLNNTFNIQSLNVDVFNMHRFLKDFFYQLALG